MSFFKLSAPLGEIITLLTTAGLALQAKYHAEKKCVIKIQHLTGLLDNAKNSNVVGSDLAAVYAEMTSRGMASSSLMTNCFDVWAKEYTFGTMREGKTAYMHFKKNIREHLLEVIALRPFLASGGEYSTALNLLKNSLICFLRTYYTVGFKFYSQPFYSKDRSFSQMQVSLDKHFKSFVKQVNDLNVFIVDIDFKEIESAN